MIDVADQQRPLSEDERRELEELRAEKAAREEKRREAKERRELEELKAERERDRREAARNERDRELRERNARLMEPDDDLRMATGQKIVLVAIFAVVVAIVIAMTMG